MKHPKVPGLFQNYGLGVGLRAPHFPVFLSDEGRPRDVKWVEVVSENFMAWKSQANPRALQTLHAIREHYPVALHGVSMNLGSADDLDQDYLKSLKALSDQIQPIVISDHLCWTAVNGVQTHDLNPLPYTFQLATHVAQKIMRAQDFLGRKLLIENVSSYLTFEDSEMTEDEFVSEVVRVSDCGLLLDINNVYVSSVNHQFDAKQFLKNIPHERVGQIHIAGHTKKENGFLIDTHDHSVPQGVWDLTQWYSQNYGLPSTMIERDGNIPEWAELHSELQTLKELL